ncbi:calcium-binding protein P-like isoform X4 [Penaeus monodon]|uniref:calcium-binding protein P-like isoform X4 n=1 Tax=Penaeus monodon TaxID=6687 RepID=UPI0018A6DA25|nr:calcium-binding protein P-like isoform X4 [Penaeus monodon]XP_037796661.1 calcium-binding protein P-like isoform X4 [Penaeus monodon]
MLVKMCVKMLVCAAFLLAAPSTIQGFNVGVSGTKCNLDPSKGDINDPCARLYDGVCKGRYCGCPTGTHEDKNLGVCVPGEASKTAGGTQAGRPGSAFDDLPFDFPGGGGSTGGTAPKAPPAPAPAPQPRPPPPPQPGYPGSNQPGFNPNQPGYNPNQPGYNPNQPGYNPNQPGYNPNRPGYNPNQPGYNPNQRGGHGTTRGGSDVGEKAGGGVGGVIGLLLIGGLIYFCCCRGGKHKQVMNRFQGLPFMRGGQAGGQGPVALQSQPVQQDPNFGSQHTYVPPGQPVPQGQYPPPQQPYPTGYPVDGQKPPPYTQEYQPNAPPS